MMQAAENFVVVLIGGGGSSHCGMYPSKDPRIKLSSSTICVRDGLKGEVVINVVTFQFSIDHVPVNIWFSFVNS